MKRILILYFIFALNIPLIAQLNKNGVPFIKNYTPKDYNAAEQNWCITEDHRGVMYFGNTDNGILEFDGNIWSSIPISNGSIIRALATSDDGVVYVGGVDEFGYLAPDISGKMHYESLTFQLDTIDFKDIYKVFTIKEDVYFCSIGKIYKFRNKKLINIYKNWGLSFLSFQINDKIYWGTIERGLCELQNDTVIVSKGGEFYKEMDIFTMLPWSKNEVLIVVNGKGLFIYNQETGLSKLFKSLGENYNQLSDLIGNSQVYNGVKLSNGNYALATLDNGCIVFSQEGKGVFKIDPENGLQDLTVINLYETRNGNLWFGLNKGISYAELSTPFTRLGQEYGFEGIILDVYRYNETLFIATNLGLYYLNYENGSLPKFYSIDQLSGQTVWQISKFKNPRTQKDEMIFATSIGVFKYNSNNTVTEISEHIYHTEFIYQSKLHPERIYIGYTYGLAWLEYKDGKFIDHNKLIDCNDYISSIIEDDKGNIWLGTSLTGVIKINSDLTYVKYGVDQGLPDLNLNKVFYIENEVVCATINGLYKFDSNKDSFVKYDGFGEKYYDSDEMIKDIYFEKNNEYWIVSKNSDTKYEQLEKISISQDRIITVNDTPFKRLVKNSFHEVRHDDENGVWIATSDAIYNYNERNYNDFYKYYSSIMRKTEIALDSVIFWGTYYNDTVDFIVDNFQHDLLKKIFKYRNNSIRFYYSSPYFPTEELKYSHRLDGFEENWSAWNEETKRRYTNLNEGKYTFQIKAKNIYGIVSEVASYEFFIKPPWYRTIVAYIVYVILAILVIVVIVKIYTRRLELEKIRLEQIVKERTEEVVKQKEEIEQQRDEIADKNRSITDSIEYASRIQNAILPSKEFADEILPEHFILFRPRDIVSGDFYWMTKKDNLLVMIAADCTGHGVPGAFMSMLGVSFLNEIVNRHEIISADKILNQLRADVKKTMGQKGREGEAKDGMDIALCIVDLENLKMQYAGAYNPLYLFRNNELLETKADRMPIGIYIKEKESFTNNEIDLQKGDVFYIFSDGYQDQFGGEDGMKFKTKNYKQLLLEIHQKPMLEQKEILNTTIDKWRGKWEQVDDIIILGVRV